MYEVSGTCNKCGLFTRVPLQLNLTEEEKLKEAMLFLCHYHDGQHAFELGEDAAPQIVAAVVPAGRPLPSTVAAPDRRKVATKSYKSAPPPMDDDEDADRDGHYHEPKPRGRQRNRQHA